LKKDVNKKRVKILVALIVLVIVISTVTIMVQNLNKSNNNSSAGALPLPHPLMVVDSSNNVHVLWFQGTTFNEDYGISYIKLNTAGKIIVPHNIIIVPSNFTGYGFSVYIDEFDFIHIKYGDQYAKINSEGMVIERDIPIAEKLLIPGLSIFRYNNNSYASFSSSEAVHSDGLIYKILNDNLILKIYNTNGTLRLEKNIVNDTSVGFTKIIVDDDNNIHIFSLYGLGAHWRYIKTNNTGEIIFDQYITTEEANEEVSFFSMQYHNNEIFIKYDIFNYDTRKSSIQFLNIDLNGTTLKTYTFDTATPHSSFIIDGVDNYCVISINDYPLELTFQKLDSNFNTLVHPFVINNEPDNPVFILVVVIPIAITIPVTALYIRKRRQRNKENESEDGKKGSG